MEFSGIAKLKVKLTPERDTDDDGNLCVSWKAVITLEEDAVGDIEQLGLFQGQEVEYVITVRQGVLGEEQGKPMLEPFADRVGRVLVDKFGAENVKRDVALR